MLACVPSGHGLRLAEFVADKHHWILATRLGSSTCPRPAIADQGKCVIVVEPTRWGPISTGGFPPSLFEDG